MNEDQAKQLTPQQRFAVAIGKLQGALIESHTVPGPEGLMFNFDPVGATLQASIDSAALLTLVDALVGAGILNGADLMLANAKRLELMADNFRAEARKPRILVPK